jgi:hypothetical protein
MVWDEVKATAKALIEYAGAEGRVNALDPAVKSRVLNAHIWERFMVKGTIAYAAGAEFVDLAVNEYKDIHRIISISVQGSMYSPPSYETPAEYNRLVTMGWGTEPTVAKWTMIGRKLYLLGRPSSAATLVVIYMRTAGNVGWAELTDDYMDFSSLVLARMLTPAKVELAGTISDNPVYLALRSLEKDALHDLVKLEYRQPGRDYKARLDDMIVIRREQYEGGSSDW